MTNRIKAVRIDGRVFTHPLWQYHSEILTSAYDALCEEGADRDQLLADIDAGLIRVEFGYMRGGVGGEFRTPSYLELMAAAENG